MKESAAQHLARLYEGRLAVPDALRRSLLHEAFTRER
jgi:hypothetical protein